MQKTWKNQCSGAADVYQSYKTSRKTENDRNIRKNLLTAEIRGSYFDVNRLIYFTKVII